MHQVYLGLGSNIGDRRQCIADAIRLISERVGTVLRQSSLIETEPWGFNSENRFLNGVILCETSLTPRQVLKATQKIERALGRRQKSIGADTDVPVYHDRPIDIDILLYDDLSVDEPDLKIPHPLMYERDFVMIPLNEIRK
ncbi:MAG: 2-amino-4-hydroxy-6-hydroxymethyldihydropteridine diphosphokinase [Prevotella sp.]|jgi:2-amino-4-hydroxy-6-hydroxymethyldihydropteridine diphosphokinase|nr:2-amino-4-hydroxy-6-hydroxymethyldihydropteridine diphosphokinase [Prevotella sp.]